MNWSLMSDLDSGCIIWTNVPALFIKAVNVVVELDSSAFIAMLALKSQGKRIVIPLNGSVSTFFCGLNSSKAIYHLISV